jgi:hypothetical protein
MRKIIAAGQLIVIMCFSSYREIVVRFLIKNPARMSGKRYRLGAIKTITCKPQ